MPARPAIRRCFVVPLAVAIAAGQAYWGFGMQRGAASCEASFAPVCCGCRTAAGCDMPCCQPRPALPHGASPEALAGSGERAASVGMAANILESHALAARPLAWVRLGADPAGWDAAFTLIAQHVRLQI